MESNIWFALTQGVLFEQSIRQRHETRDDPYLAMMLREHFPLVNFLDNAEAAAVRFERARKQMEENYDRLWIEYNKGQKDALYKIPADAVSDASKLLKSLLNLLQYKVLKEETTTSPFSTPSL